ncbi:sigma-54-dependent transcriptional regulator [Eionea flava]
MMKNNILIIDDEPDIRQLLTITLERMNFNVHTAQDLKEAYQAIKSYNYQLCISDLKLPDGSGLDIVDYINNNHPKTPTIVITAHGSMDIAVQAMKLGAFDFINKPFDLKHFRQLINNATLSTQAAKSNDSLSSIIGESLPIKKLKEKITQVSRSQAPIFITGESGSGKEVVANAIHQSSPRKEKPFIAINCGAIPKELMESELFGHKKGSFTGAHQDKQGLFETANGGTLFFDEIADLPLDMQVKLLRVIQEKKIRPIGTQTETSIDVRILSASHQHLLDSVRQKTFRNDLYYRLNVIEISVPPLRERLEDIPILSNFILNKITQRNQSSPFLIDTSALKTLQKYTFPGNVRELENVLERACALTDNHTIDQHHCLLATEDHAAKKNIPTSVKNEHKRLPPNEQESSKKSPEKYDASVESIDSYLEKIEKEILLDALTSMRWNRTATAKKLGISFRSLRYRLKKLNIDIDNDT